MNKFNIRVIYDKDYYVPNTIDHHRYYKYRINNDYQYIGIGLKKYIK
jgi:hypothetical protein